VASVPTFWPCIDQSAKDFNEFNRERRAGASPWQCRVGTGPHIGAEYFFREVARCKPCMCRSPAALGGHAAIGNHVDAIVLTRDGGATHHARASARIGLAKCRAQPAVPNVPPYGEMGSPTSIRLVGRLLRAGEDADAVVAKLNAEINAIMREPQAQESSDHRLSR